MMMIWFYILQKHLKQKHNKPQQLQKKGHPLFKRK